MSERLAQLAPEPPGADADEEARERDQGEQVGPHDVEPGALHEHAARDRREVRDRVEVRQRLDPRRHRLDRRQAEGLLDVVDRRHEHVGCGEPVVAHLGIEPSDDAQRIGDAEARGALEQLLLAHGHEVVTAADGVEALEHLARERFDAVVVDLQMPRLGGRGVYEEVQRKTPDLARRFVFVTGDDVRAASHEFLQQVRQPTVRKPYDIDDLLAAVNEVSGPS